MSLRPTKYFVDTDVTPRLAKVVTGPNRNQRKYRRRLVNRLGMYNTLMTRTVGRRTTVTVARGEGFTNKRDAERFARKHNGVIWNAFTDR